MSNKRVLLSGEVLNKKNKRMKDSKSQKTLRDNLSSKEQKRFDIMNNIFLALIDGGIDINKAKNITNKIVTDDLFKTDKNISQSVQREFDELNEIVSTDNQDKTDDFDDLSEEWSTKTLTTQDDIPRLEESMSETAYRELMEIEPRVELLPVSRAVYHGNKGRSKKQKQNKKNKKHTKKKPKRR